MELSDLVTFSTVARLGGITRAADELNTVQSNVTQRVKALEAEIGTALFERHSRGMTLTGAGRRLLALCAADGRAVARGGAGRARRRRAEGTAVDRLDGDDCRGTPACPARRISSALSGGALERCGPRPTADLVAAVLDGALDGAFVAGPIDHAELSSTVTLSRKNWCS